jgi:hypothetical protein
MIAMADEKPRGFVIRVTTPGAIGPEDYGVIAVTAEEALVAVSNALNTTNEKVDVHRVLTEGLVRQHALEPGKVKKLG